MAKSQPETPRTSKLDPNSQPETPGASSSQVTSHPETPKSSRPTFKFKRTPKNSKADSQETQMLVESDW